MKCPFRKIQPAYCNGEDSTRIEGFGDCYEKECMAWCDIIKENAERGGGPLAGTPQPYCTLIRKGTVLNV